jgi:hypothetical protein
MRAIDNKCNLLSSPPSLPQKPLGPSSYLLSCRAVPQMGSFVSSADCTLRGSLTLQLPTILRRGQLTRCHELKIATELVKRCHRTCLTIQGVP